VEARTPNKFRFSNSELEFIGKEVKEGRGATKGLLAEFVKAFDLGGDEAYHPTFEQLKGRVGHLRRADPMRSETAEAISAVLEGKEFIGTDRSTEIGSTAPFFLSKLFGSMEYDDAAAELDKGLDDASFETRFGTNEGGDEFFVQITSKTLLKNVGRAAGTKFPLTIEALGQFEVHSDNTFKLTKVDFDTFVVGVSDRRRCFGGYHS
jgi:hypothetical protein